MGLKNYIIDKYLTWKTGEDKETREWRAWYETHVVYSASTIDNMFMHFKHIILVNTEKFTNPYEPMDWVPCDDAKQYFWPQRTKEETCVWRFERVTWDKWDHCWHIDNCFGTQDKIFVATNSDEDALMISLKYS
jgi:hypothetical protein